MRVENVVAKYREQLLCCKVQKSKESQEMDVVDETFDEDITEVKASRSRANRMAELAFNDRINTLAFPTLPLSTTRD